MAEASSANNDVALLRNGWSEGTAGLRRRHRNGGCCCLPGILGRRSFARLFGGMPAKAPRTSWKVWAVHRWDRAPVTFRDIVHTHKGVHAARLCNNGLVGPSDVIGHGYGRQHRAYKTLVP